MGNICCTSQKDEKNNELNNMNNKNEGSGENIQNQQTYFPQEIQVPLIRFQTNFDKFVISVQKIPQPFYNQNDLEDGIQNIPTRTNDHPNNINDSINKIINSSKKIIEFGKGNDYSEDEINKINKFTDELQISAIMLDNFAQRINEPNYSQQLQSYINVIGPKSVNSSSKSNGQNRNKNNGLLEQSQYFEQTNILSTGVRF